MHCQHLVHVADVDRDAAVRRVDVAFERGAGAERMTGTRCAAQMRTISCTSSVDCGNTTASGGWFLDPGDGVAVLLAHRLGGHDAIAEARRECAHRRIDGPGIAP